MSRVTVATVNAALRAAVQDIRLVRGVGAGYFYFSGPGTEVWPETAVYVTSAAQMSVRQWLDEYKRLRDWDKP